ncbi:MAG: phosphonate ABC transporter substrate-binding protein [Kiloniellales bacterium]|nr:phosphonate ABC transporter substrate-binding protein [Kiloniellales bacterium]
MITKFARATAVAATMLMAGSAAAEEMKTLNFGIISTESTQNLKTIWDPFIEDMSKKLGLEVKAFFAPDYAGVIEAMRFDKVDLAWFGNKSAMEAVDRAGGEVFVQTVDVDGNPGYWSLLLAHKDSPINKLEDVLSCDKSLVFGNGDPNSTSGFLVPSYYVFAQNNVTPSDCYKAVRNASHETNSIAVANKQVDFATNNTENLRRLAKTNPKARENVKVIWQSPLIPSDPIVYRKNLPEEMRMRLKAFFLAYGRLGTDVENEKEILAGLQWAPFRDSSDAQLYPIRQLQLFRDKLKLEADDRLDADEKAKKVGEIEAELATLKVLAGATATD